MMAATPFMAGISDGAPQWMAELPGFSLPWLDAARRTQLEAFLRDGLPAAHNEAWKYTYNTLRGLQRRSYVLGDEDAGARGLDPASLALPGVDGPRLVFVNGVFREDLSTFDGLQNGLTIQPLSVALREDPEPLRFFLTRDWKHLEDAFNRLNAAFASDGVVLRVGDGVRVGKPVHIVHVGVTGEAELAWHVRSVIEVGTGASLKLVEHFVAEGEPTNLGTLVCDMVVREDAELDWVMLQNASPKTTLVRHHAIHQDAHSQVRIHSLEFGGKLVRNDLDIELRGDGARLSTRGIFAPHARQHLDTHLDIRHAALNTESDAVWRGVADQGGHGVFHGQILIDPGADGTDASLFNKNLLLSPQAAIDTQPALEIYADEVMAVHGATVGQLDENSLFYMRSRGIPPALARQILTAAFCRVAIEGMANEPLREHVDGLLTAVLPSVEVVA